MNKTILLIIFLCCYCFSGFAQENDSTFIALEKEIKLAQNDTTKIKVLYEVGMYYFERGNPEALTYFDKGLLLINNTPKTTAIQRQKINYLSRIGGILRKKGDYEASLKKYQKAQKIAHQLEDSFLVAELNHNIGNVFGDKGESQKAINYLQEAIKIKERFTDTLSIAHSYAVIGVFYRKLKKLDSALHYYDKASKRYNYLQKEDDKIAMKSNMSVIYIIRKEYDITISLLKEVIDYHKRKEDIASLAKAYYNIARPYRNLKDYTTSKKYLDSSLHKAKSKNLKPRIVKVYRELAGVYFRNKEYKKAYRAHKKYKTYSDSIFNNKTSQRIAALEYDHKLEIEKIENAQNLQEQKDRLALSEKQKLIYILVSILLLIIGFLITRMIKKKSKEKLLLVSSKLQKEQIEKLNAELALKTRESELKKAAVHNSLRQEVTSKILDDIKDIISIQDEKERVSALKSLSAVLLSEKLGQKKAVDVQSYINKVNIEFKVALDKHFPKLKQKEKDLLCLMELSLNTNDIKIILNTTIASVKSSRYRIRKKLDLDSTTDMIEYIKKL